MPAEETRRVKIYIDANFQRAADATDIAGALGYSVSHVTDVFRRHQGLTPAAYLLDRRLEHAVQLLKSRPSLSTAEVGRRSGFGSYQTFHRNFVARYGMPPARYRGATTMRTRVPDAN